MRRKIPASNTLLCFDAATSHRSLTRAAVELALTQSAASRQIHALVKYLGAALFERTHHGMELCPGQVFSHMPIGRLIADFCSKALGGKLPSLECSRWLL
jgi:Bacterial regulatory helix-turn-helix protein, lysR family